MQIHEGEGVITAWAAKLESGQSGLTTPGSLLARDYGQIIHLSQ